ncbi:penicillin-binding transpeptidase domain-containing protein [Haemophilus parahaemolyticus]|uniref:penicillin-binding transpeptidase domain-containing protein n=1 Tax=Haemophilus parahaemolyticus TaxID=735 RepID=UPI00058BA60F|nr:penicillin-binding transpeptidase domain-containing protein [Haemophilus parahaemolyticus]
MARGVKQKDKQKSFFDFFKRKQENNGAENQEEKASYLPKRFYFILGGVGIAVFALVFQAVVVQVIHSPRLIKEANNRSLRTIELPFTRGSILDRNGKFLSVSAPMYSITIDPREYFDSKIKRSEETLIALAIETGSSKSKMVKSIQQFLDKKNLSAENVDVDPRAILNTQDPKYWTLLSESTGISPEKLVEVRQNPNSYFVQLENAEAKLERDKWQAFAKSVKVPYSEMMDRLYKAHRQRFIYLARHETESIARYTQELKLNAIVLREESRRFYPLVEEASQLIGFTDIDDKHGSEGLERSFDTLLIGKSGKQVIRKDARGNIIENIRDEKEYNPQDVVLSIDQDLQSMVYREIKNAVKENNAISGTAVLVDVQTGEILAMANAPSFNPNNRSDLKPELIRNRAITDTFEPGSTVKPFTVLTALQNGVTYRDEVINTHPFVVNGHTIRDVAPRDSLSITGILQKSSNIGVSRLALRMPSTALVDTYSKIGFGKDTGLGLGEQRGTNGDRKRWSDIERATLAYGYGLNVTPLQLARAYATLGSFGIYRPLSITKVDPPVIGERVLPEKITRDVVHMMESVAQKGEGGQKAMVEGYRVAVKTGTARKLEKGQYVEKYLAYTAGLAPASNPRFALVVLMNEPKAGNYYGGAVSAPLFSKIMGYTLKAYNIKPDNLIE